MIRSRCVWGPRQRVTTKSDPGPAFSDACSQTSRNSGKSRITRSSRPTWWAVLEDITRMLLRPRSTSPIARRGFLTGNTGRRTREGRTATAIGVRGRRRGAPRPRPESQNSPSRLPLMVESIPSKRLTSISRLRGAARKNCSTGPHRLQTVLIVRRRRLVARPGGAQQVFPPSVGVPMRCRAAPGSVRRRRSRAGAAAPDAGPPASRPSASAAVRRSRRPRTARESPACPPPAVWPPARPRRASSGGRRRGPRPGGRPRGPGAVFNIGNCNCNRPACSVAGPASPRACIGLEELRRPKQRGPPLPPSAPLPRVGEGSETDDGRLPEPCACATGAA
jgi:hypothetical protein